jgi:hypothetical protein
VNIFFTFHEINMNISLFPVALSLCNVGSTSGGYRLKNRWRENSNGMVVERTVHMTTSMNKLYENSSHVVLNISISSGTVYKWRPYSRAVQWHYPYRRFRESQDLYCLYVSWIMPSDLFQITMNFWIYGSADWIRGMLPTTQFSIFCLPVSTKI